MCFARPAPKASVVRWRAAIPSVVCIGIVRPGTKLLQRVGSGCLVEGGQSGAMVLTNWHLFREFVDYSGAVSAVGAPLGPPELGPAVDVRRHRFQPSLLSSSWLEPGTTIVLGTSHPGGPLWSLARGAILYRLGRIPPAPHHPASPPACTPPVPLLP